MADAVILRRCRAAMCSGTREGSRVLVVVIAAAVMLALLLPLPPSLVDVLLALGLGSAVGVLVVAMVVPDPLSLTSVPPVLVMTSLGRIVLCVAISRLALSRGEGGSLAQTLGQAAGGGDAIAGAGVLIVLAVVHLVMVTTGVGRMAEVAARFALDALPGRQMGLDSAIAAGHLSAQESRTVLARLEGEASFFGAMDGATRLLRGEAVAAIVIVAVTAIGGVAHALAGQADPADAVAAAATLATGHGLVTLLPALVMTVAAGLVLSRSTGDASLIEQVSGQMLLSPWPAAAAAVALIGLGLFPGVAKLPTLLSGALLIGLACWAGWRGSSEQTGEPHRARPGGSSSQLALEVGIGLLEVVQSSDGLMEALPKLRERLSRRLGFAIPGIVVRDSLELGATEYAVVYRAGTLARGQIRPGRVLAVAPRAGVMPDFGAMAELPDGRTGVWVTAEEATELADLGFILMAPREALMAHLRSILLRHAAELCDLERAAKLIEEVARSHPAVAEAAKAAGIEAGLLRRVCAELLSGGISLRDPVSVLEAMVEAVAHSRDPEEIALRVRPALGAMIADDLSDGGRIRAIMLAPELHEALAEATVREDGRQVAAMMPAVASAWEDLLNQVGTEHGWGRPVALIAEPRSLAALQSLCRRVGPAIVAVRPTDLAPEAQMECIVTLRPEQLA
ncbi:MAG: FHIPEP family type III secretion protein [candidate division WS1 bacterium]|nr:FHIPEP family type III secretion protein [candidate division WS1 bacterium]